MHKQLDSMLDLSKGERQYLARKGITGREFDHMSPLEQNEWKEEMQDGSYAANDRDYGTQNARFTY